MTTFRQRLTQYAIGILSVLSQEQSATVGDDELRWHRRQLRYAILMAHYDRSVYQNHHPWSQGYKSQNKLYKHVRPLSSAPRTIADFQTTHIWGGDLFDSSGNISAIPFIADNSVIEHIKSILLASNFSMLKDVIVLNGCVTGDAIVESSFDGVSVKITYCDPGDFKSMLSDGVGNVIRYEKELDIVDPNNNQSSARYNEIATLNDGIVTYETFLNGAPHDFNGQGHSFDVDLPFIPIVHIKHIDKGFDWGIGEFTSTLHLIREIDDIRSLVSDGIRISTRPRWFASGIPDPSKTRGNNRQSSASRGKRDASEIVYGPAGSSIKAFGTNINVPSALLHIEQLNQTVKTDHVEVRLEDLRAMANVSAETMARAMVQAEDLIRARRSVYDRKLEAILKIALVMASKFGVDDFNYKSLDEINLEIGDRDVFSTPEHLPPNGEEA